MPKYLDWRAQNHVFEDIAGSGWVSGFTMSGRQEPAPILGLPVTASFFRVFGVQTLYGRTFFEEEEKPGHDQVVVLSLATDSGNDTLIPIPKCLVRG